MNAWETAAGALRSHPWVARAALCADGAAVLPSAAGVEALRTRGRQALIEHWQAALAGHGMPAPAVWRLCDAWTHDTAETLLAQPRPAAAILEGERTDDTGARELSLRLPLDLACFADHFPVLPVLPGVLQLQWALAYGAERFGTPRACRRMEMLKFQSLLRPGDRPVLRLRFDTAAQRLHFAYRLGEADASSGRFAWEEDVP